MVALGGLNCCFAEQALAHALLRMRAQAARWHIRVTFGMPFQRVADAVYSSHNAGVNQVHAQK